MDVSLSTALDFIGKGGVLGAVVFALVGFNKGWWFSKEYVTELRDRIKELERDRDEWKILALSGTQAAERAVTLATRRQPRLKP